jgi:hypothetical protein
MKSWTPKGSPKPLAQQLQDATKRDAVIARVILADAEEYEGLQVLWAKAVLARVGSVREGGL